MQNKSLPVALLIFIAASLGAISVFQKFLHFSIGHTVYYCQNIIRSISFQIPQTIGLIFIGIFALMVLLGATKFILSWHKTVRQKNALETSKKASPKIAALIQKYGLEDKLIEIKNKRIFAFCLGLHKPKIYISTGLISKMTKSELEAIVLHEKCHLKHNDPLILTILSSIYSLFPYLPVFSDLIRNLRIERELQADRQVVLSLGGNQELLSVMRKLLSLPKKDNFAFSLGIGDQDTIELRIQALLGSNLAYRKFYPLNIIISLIVAVALSLTALAPVQAIENHENGNDVMMICPNNDSCVSWCQRNQSVNPTTPMENSSHPFSTK